LINIVIEIPTRIIPSPCIEPEAKMIIEFRQQSVNKKAFDARLFTENTVREIIRLVASPSKEDIKLMFPRVANGSF